MKRSERGGIQVGGWSDSVILWWMVGWQSKERERKKQLVKCVVRQTKERKETSRQGSEEIRQQNYNKAIRRYSSKAIDFLLWYFGHYVILWGYFRSFIFEETMKWNRRFEFKTCDFEKVTISCVMETYIFIVFKNTNFKIAKLNARHLAKIHIFV